MTQLRFHPNSISNYFDMLLNGIGHRGSSFSDIDAVSHDARTNRFLIQEFKREGEDIPVGQHWMLRGLASIPNHFTVWHVAKRIDGAIGFAVFGEPLRVITIKEYQERFRAWWAHQPYRPQVSMLETTNADQFERRSRHAAQMSDEQVVAYLDFVKSSLETEDDRIWRDVLQAEVRRRSVVKV